MQIFKLNNKVSIFILLAIILSVIVFLKNQENSLITEDIIRRSLNGKLAPSTIEREIFSMKQGYKFSLILVAITSLFNILSTTTIILFAFEFSKIKIVTFSNILKVVLISYIIFAVSDFFKIFLLQRTTQDLTLQDFKFYKPGSALDIIPISSLDKAVVFLFSKIHLGVLLFLLFVSIGINILYKQLDFNRISVIVLSSVGGLYLLYVLVVSFIFTII